MNRLLLAGVIICSTIVIVFLVRQIVDGKRTHYHYRLDGRQR